MLQQNAVLTFTAFCGKIAVRQQILTKVFKIDKKKSVYFCKYYHTTCCGSEYLFALL